MDFFAEVIAEIFAGMSFGVTDRWNSRKERKKAKKNKRATN